MGTIVYAFTLCFFVTTGAVDVPARSAASTLTVSAFNVQEQRTADVLQALAKKARVVIGISGELTGSDRKFISISTGETSLKRVLDEICIKDSRYRWQDTEDGNISVAVGKERPGLLDLVVRKVKLTHVDSYDVAILISQLPEVKAWTAQTKCGVGEVVSTGSAPPAWDVDVDANNEVLWRLLNDLSAQNGTYFWSAIKFSNDPCTINLTP